MFFMYATGSIVPFVKQVFKRVWISVLMMSGDSSVALAYNPDRQRRVRSIPAHGGGILIAYPRNPRTFFVFRPLNMLALMG
jgi:hypothetical protein